MTRSSVVIPLHQLPPGYARSWKDLPGNAVTPHPAATLALIRKAQGEDLEILLLERSHRTRFIPGAFVFPGGRVDAEDRLDDPRPGSDGDSVGGVLEGADSVGSTLSKGAYLRAALRETFEETGILLAKDGGSVLSFPATGKSLGSRLRQRLHRGESTFREILQALGVEADRDRLVPIGHWVTPVQEDYRYDTLFFAAQVPPDCPAYPDGVEMVRGHWLSPRKALEMNRDGRLPLVFPTLRTLEALTPFSHPQEALQHLGSKEIPRLLPEVEETGEGIQVTLEDPRAPML